jgi:hypothetical protein
MSFDLNTIMRQVWNDEKETDSHKAARYVAKLIPQDELEGVFLDLLADKWSTFLSRLSRSSPLGEPAQKPRRHNPAINPRVIGEKVLADLDERPFYVPSRGAHARVAFRDMTIACWNEYAAYRRERARGYEASARWGELNAEKLEAYQAETSGMLPPEVKHELFSMLPPEEE